VFRFNKIVIFAGITGAKKYICRLIFEDMALIHASGYPIYHAFNNPGAGSTIYYDISLGQTTLYSGKIVTFNNDATVQIDIAPIVRGYLHASYTDLIWQKVNPAQVSNAALIFRVTSAESGEDATYTVIYNYNTEYQSIISSSGKSYDPFCFEVDARQLITACVYDISSATVEAQVVLIRTGERIKLSIPGGSICYFPFNLRDFTTPLIPGDTVVLELVWGYYRYTVVPQCANRFALYYVNKVGGLDSLLCTGKIVESWEPERTDVQLYNDRSSRRGWEQKRIFQEIKHQWQLNTGFIKPEYLDRIDNLIYSPEVFLHDLEKDTITTVLITDSSYNVKNRQNGDKPFYSITVVDSRKQIRI
jgi:hypothetical protein